MVAPPLPEAPPLAPELPLLDVLPPAPKPMVPVDLPPPAPAALKVVLKGLPPLPPAFEAELPPPEPLLELPPVLLVWLALPPDSIIGWAGMSFFDAQPTISTTVIAITL